MADSSVVLLEIQMVGLLEMWARKRVNCWGDQLALQRVLRKVLQMDSHSECNWVLLMANTKVSKMVR
jgi:hypothetical protein